MGLFRHRQRTAPAQAEAAAANEDSFEVHFLGYISTFDEYKRDFSEVYAHFNQHWYQLWIALSVQKKAYFPFMIIIKQEDRPAESLNQVNQQESWGEENKPWKDACRNATVEMLLTPMLATDGIPPYLYSRNERAARNDERCW